MIEQIIALLKIDNFYGISESIDIAKGKYLLSDSFRVNYKQGKRGNKKMKVEISEDQNTLTVDGVEYEAKLNNAKSFSSACKSCAFYDNGFCKIGLETPLGLNASNVRHCEYPYRNDGKSIYWIKKEAEQVNKQNINFSDDENSLTIKDGFYKGEYTTKIDVDACDDCFFFRDDSCSLGGMSRTRCAPKNRVDGKSIIWIKKENTEMTKAPAPALQHRHFDLIVQWAKDPTQKVWFWSRDDYWEQVSKFTWTSDFYVIGNKPTAPPMKKLKVKIELDRNEFEIQVPCDSRPQEIDKAIMDMATQYVVVTQEVI